MMKSTWYTKLSSSITPLILVTMFILAVVVVSLGSYQQRTAAATATVQQQAGPNNRIATELPLVNMTQNKGPISVLKLAKSKVAIDIPLVKGYEKGSLIFFVVFDASNNQIAKMITNYTRFPVHFTPVLAKTPDTAVTESYIFKNGIKGNGTLGFQPTIVDTKPGDTGYSPLKHLNFVEWKRDKIARELKSVNELMAAQKNGELTINNTNVVMNSPAIKWQSGSLKIRQDKNITDETSFAGGQVTKIDTAKMVVTMVAMRGWGPDGKTLYWLATDAAPFTDDITKGGIVYAQADEKLASTAVAVDFYQFLNGIKGAGPQGFQSPIALTNLNDPNYSPMWRILFVVWKDPSKARVLETLSDISEMQKAGLVTIIPALNGKHIVNCPFFDQSTVFEYQRKGL